MKRVLKENKVDLINNFQNILFFIILFTTFSRKLTIDKCLDRCLDSVWFILWVFRYWNVDLSSDYSNSFRPKQISRGNIDH